MEDNLLFEIGDTIKIVKGEMEKNGFYIAHEIMRPDLYDKNAEESRVLGYRRIQSLNVYGKKNMIYSADYQESIGGFLRAYHTRIVLCEKAMFNKTLSFIKV